MKRSDSFLRTVVRAARWHRRLLSGVAAAAAVYFALGALAPPQAPTVAVLAAARDLPGGTKPTPADVRTIRLPPAVVPTGALRPGTTTTDRILANPVRAGEPLTDARFLTPTALPPGLVAYPLRLEDPALAPLLHPGDHLNLYAATSTSTDTATQVASGVRVLALPAPTARTTATGTLVVLAATPATVARLAQASTNSRITAALAPDTS
ncbi:Flp pilus assembly protein CpaB [Kribbella amoyensis]|uniref:Flp pilus assembly protein CpaB n=1 Tax=Kribbella amoyensis TaxID=996641 RepID=A0A561BJY7_9ACTN|nr:Flp pilus assembly protein CpaB [Kribbella amoyensis]TWD79092.1 Flp pilus assembly protein CpaB [Kribbella amoyensis]